MYSSSSSSFLKRKSRDNLASPKAAVRVHLPTVRRIDLPTIGQRQIPIRAMETKQKIRLSTKTYLSEISRHSPCWILAKSPKIAKLLLSTCSNSQPVAKASLTLVEAPAHLKLNLPVSTKKLEAWTFRALERQLRLPRTHLRSKRPLSRKLPISWWISRKFRVKRHLHSFLSKISFRTLLRLTQEETLDSTRLLRTTL